jgi:hypothetical protein
MYWLAINREWTTIAELQDDIVPPISRATLLESLESLTRRSLIKKRSGEYTLQPVVMEYVTIANAIPHRINRINTELSQVSRQAPEYLIDEYTDYCYFSKPD